MKAVAVYPGKPNSFVLGNKVAVGSVNANRVYFERGVQDMALAVAQYPGWLKRLRFILLHPSKGKP